MTPTGRPPRATTRDERARDAVTYSPNAAGDSNRDSGSEGGRHGRDRHESFSHGRHEHPGSRSGVAS
ncbi:hypothetical protein BRD10_00675 [Halobacteriales archaeon SW_12_71_31]|nr:MAG: hypothetical protein BRD10_00675 [Halobacteriales archaeon SW_12_71_31]